MKYLVFALLLSAVLCGCPFGFKDEGEQQKEVLKANPTCPSGQVVINGQCQINDLSHSNALISQQVTDQLTIGYEIANDENSVNFIVELDQLTWHGLGFGYSMLDVDMIITEINPDNTVHIWQSLSVKEGRPQPYSSQYGIKLLGYDLSNGKLKVKYNRLFDTGLPGFAILTPYKKQHFVTAYSPNGHKKLNYHGDNFFDMIGYIGGKFQTEQPVQEEVVSEELDIVSTLERIFNGLF